MSSIPEPSFAHLVRLTDDTGLLEHARGALPLRVHGYCVDDVARGLVVVCREPSPAPVLVNLAATYLAFIIHAQTSDGTFHNRLGYDRRWLDGSDTGDWWGRAVWGLGTAIARAPERWMSDVALTCFDLAARNRSRWARAMAFAGLGAAEVLSVAPDHDGARRLLADATTTVGPATADSEWPWPEQRLAYANAALAEVHLAAGEYLADERGVTTGLLLLEWLLRTETHDGHLSTTPVGGWGPGEARPGFDQQPLEAATMADACVRAMRLADDSATWTNGLDMAVGWFLGDNDSKVELFDSMTGGCSDGLRSSGCSDNEGAESTLALISTLQRARGLLRASHGG
jgi:hypothetical protein